MVSWLGVKGGNVHYSEKTHCCIKAITTWVKYVNLCRFESLLQPDLTECQWCNSLTGFEYHVSLERERKLTHGHFIKLLLAPANKCLCFTQHPKSFWNCGCSSQRPRYRVSAVFWHISWNEELEMVSRKKKNMNWRIPSDNQRTQRHKRPKRVPKLDYIHCLWPLKAKLPVMPGFYQVNQR